MCHEKLDSTCQRLPDTCRDRRGWESLMFYVLAYSIHGPSKIHNAMLSRSSGSPSPQLRTRERLTRKICLVSHAASIQAKGFVSTHQSSGITSQDQGI